MAGPSQDLTGYNETDTLLRQVEWLSYWLIDIAKEYKSTITAVQSCRDALREPTKDNAETKCAAARMILSGICNHSKECYDDDGHDVVESIVTSAAQLSDIGNRKIPVPVRRPIEMTAEVTVDPYDIKMFEQSIGELIRNREYLQKIFSKYYSKYNPNVRVTLEVINHLGESIRAEKMDAGPIIQAHLLRKAEEKIAKGQVSGFNDAVPEPLKVPEHLPDDHVNDAGDIPPPPPPGANEASSTTEGGDA